MKSRSILDHHVYKIIVDNKVVYIGYSADIMQREDTHRTHASKPNTHSQFIHKLLFDMGATNFKMDIVASFTTRKKALQFEHSAIEYYQPIGNIASKNSNVSYFNAIEIESTFDPLGFDETDYSTLSEILSINKKYFTDKQYKHWLSVYKRIDQANIPAYDETRKQVFKFKQEAARALTGDV